MKKKQKIKDKQSCLAIHAKKTTKKLENYILDWRRRILDSSEKKIKHSKNQPLFEVIPPLFWV